MNSLLNKMYFCIIDKSIVITNKYIVVQRLYTTISKLILNDVCCRRLL